MSPNQGTKKGFGGRVKGAAVCPECGLHYIGKPEMKKNQQSGVRWFVYTHVDKFCRRFLGPKEEVTA